MKLSLEQEAAVRVWQAMSEIQRQHIYDSLRFVHVLCHYEKVAALDVLHKLAIPARVEPQPCPDCGITTCNGKRHER